MIKYRPHKGSIDEAMKSCKEFVEIDDMLNFIEHDWNGFVKSKDIVISESYGEDERIGWKSCRYVCIKALGDNEYDVPQCIGVCDLGDGGE